MSNRLRRRCFWDKIKSWHCHSRIVFKVSPWTGYFTVSDMGTGIRRMFCVSGIVNMIFDFFRFGWYLTPFLRLGGEFHSVLKETWNLEEAERPNRFSPFFKQILMTCRFFSFFFLQNMLFSWFFYLFSLWFYLTLRFFGMFINLKFHIFLNRMILTVFLTNANDMLFFQNMLFLWFCISSALTVTWLSVSSAFG